MANPAKEKKNKEGRDESSVMLRRLLDEVASLRAEVEAVKAEQSERRSVRMLEREPTAAKDESIVALDSVLPDVDDVDVARLAYAFSSPQKVKIVRILLTEGSLSSAQVGERTGLTTGSLYHHLRELTHSGVIEPAGRNLHSVTPLGHRTALALFRLSN